MLKVGDKAPDFSLKDQNGRTHTLSTYEDKWLVLYFYPKDNTPGCTKEACGFRDKIDVIRNEEAEVVGVSKDSVSSHQNFADRYSLPFPLLSDKDVGTIKDYKAWVKKKRFGKEYYGIKRITYIIKDGVIKKTYDNVSPKGHEEEILIDLKTLKN